MSKRCAKCEKPVYPIEELKCLDKIWHKSCFKCENCGMTLNMKNYKGYDKKPYCVAHYPTTKFTAVADTPENRRIATNTKLQSSVQYHSDFEKSKGSYTPVADTLEMKRHMENAKNISLIHYQSDFHKQKGSTTQMTGESLELKRHAENAKIYSSVQYHSGFEKQKGTASQITADSLEMKRHVENAKNLSSIKYHEAFEKQKGKRITVADDPELQRIKQNTQIQSEINYKGIKQTRDIMEQRRPEQAAQADKSKVASSPSPKKAESPKETRTASTKAPAGGHNPYAGKGMVSKAIYDYTAADTDEVSFVEGDIIIHCQPIDQGWMEGTVERTAQRGMLPSNYVQPV